MNHTWKCDSKKSEEQKEQKLVFNGALYLNSWRSKRVPGLTKKEYSGGKIISPSIFKARGSSLDQTILAVERYNIDAFLKTESKVKACWLALIPIMFDKWKGQRICAGHDNQQISVVFILLSLDSLVPFYSFGVFFLAAILLLLCYYWTS